MWDCILGIRRCKVHEQSKAPPREERGQITAKSCISPMYSPSPGADQLGGMTCQYDRNAYRLWMVTVKFSAVLLSFLQLMSPALSWNCQV